MDDNLIGQGLELMVFGMGTVVVFLTLLVFITGAMSALVERFSPAPAPDTGSGSSPEDAALLAVITAAIHKHRSRRKP